MMKCIRIPKTSTVGQPRPSRGSGCCCHAPMTTSMFCKGLQSHAETYFETFERLLVFLKRDFKLVTVKKDVTSREKIVATKLSQTIFKLTS